MGPMDGTDTRTRATSGGLVGRPVVSLLYHGTNGRDTQGPPVGDWWDVLWCPYCTMGPMDGMDTRTRATSGGLVGRPVVSLLYHGTNGRDGH